MIGHKKPLDDAGRRSATLEPVVAFAVSGVVVVVAVVVVAAVVAGTDIVSVGEAALPAPAAVPIEEGADVVVVDIGVGGGGLTSLEIVTVLAGFVRGGAAALVERSTTGAGGGAFGFAAGVSRAIVAFRLGAEGPALARAS
ncbi:MAG: hypothetical protein NVSMB68_12740 [Thermoanaerobaculia bacterium]